MMMNIKRLFILSSEYIAHLSFWSNLGMSLCARSKLVELILSCKNSIHVSFHCRDIGHYGIQQTDQLTASWVISQELELYQTYSLGLKDQYHNNSPSRFFLGKLSEKIFKNTKYSFWAPFLPKYEQKWVLTKISFCQFLGEKIKKS